MGVSVKTAAAFVAAIGTAGAAHADPWQIRIGWATTPGHMQPLIDELHKRHPDLFHHFGQSYVAAGVRYRGSTPQIQALAIGELEIAAFAPSALALAIENAHLDVRMVADVFQDGWPGYSTVTYVVRKDGPVHTVEDLKGRTVASNAIGSFGDSTMRVMLRKHHVSDRDVTTVETNFASMPAMLDDGKVDLINLVPEFSHFLREGKYRLLFTGADAQGLAQAQLWAMRADVIAQHRPALVDFFEDHIRAVQWLLAPAHHAEAVAIVAAVTKQPAATLEFVFTHADSHHAPDALPDIPATQKLIDNDVMLGVLPKRVTIAPTYVDLSLAKEAALRVKTD
jgi:ABC-type nitrate/sulfonate/bicarbonate transport system substrate-binding protein